MITSGGRLWKAGNFPRVFQGAFAEGQGAAVSSMKR